MAIIYSYPQGTPTLSDNLIGTQVDPITEENRTLQFSVGAISTLVTQNYLETTITLTAAQMLSLHTTAVQLLPSPGGTKVVKLLAVSTFLDNDTSFTSAGSAGIDIVFATTPISVQARIPITLYTGNNDYAASVVTPFESVGGIWTLPLMVYTLTPILLGGTSTFSIKLRYQILDTSAF
jgi:hypothetical protein